MVSPLSNRVLLEPIVEETSKSGIILPSERKTRRGTVVAVGPEAEQVAAGDAVLFREYGPEPLEIDGKKYLICEETDILATYTTT